MIRFFTLFFTISLLLYSCDEENTQFEPTLERPIDFYASKGDYVEKILLTWESAPSANLFHIYRYDSTLADYTKIGESKTKYFEDTTVNQPNSNYYYKIKVFNSEKEFSEFSDFDFGYIDPFLNPVDLAVSNGTSDEFVQLNWSEIHGADKYLIYRSESSHGTFEEIARIENTSYTDMEVEPIVDYYYKIRAFNNSLGYTEYSKEEKGYKLEKYEHEFSFGSWGNNNGNFNFPWGITIDDNNNVYITETANNRVQKFNSEGTYLSTITSGGLPHGIYYDDNRLYVTKSDLGKILIFDMQGNLISEFGSYGTNDGQFKGTRAITIDNSNYLYVIDAANHRIQKFDETGDFIKKWGEFDYPWGVLYVNDSILISDKQGVHKYSKEGIFDRTLDYGSRVYYMSKDANNNIYLTTSGCVIKINTQGKVVARIKNNEIGTGCFVNKNGRVYVIGDQNVHVFNPTN